MSGIAQGIKTSKAYYCLECGKCTASCPVARYNGGFSPRRIVADAIEGSAERLLTDTLLWVCLACGMCRRRCPMDVDFSGFVRSLRTAALRDGYSGLAAHGGALHSLMRMMTSAGMKQDRMWWVTEDLDVGSQGEVLYFVGCLPYFEGLFKPDLGFEPTATARATVRLLNAAGIQPVVDPNERCCGHDLLWSGDEQNFQALAERNVKAIRETGASVVVTACAECASTLRDVYPRYVGALGFEVQHLTELLSDRSGKLSFKKTDRKVTFQDPCRLVRHMGVIEAPRQALGLVPGLELVEMAHSGANATCCGTSAWMNCDQTSKLIQTERIQEAAATGAGTLVTACPKCQIHFRCALSDGKTGAGVEVEDLSVLLASCL